jgi:F-type H+-transporting ATPase subunit delta
MGEALDVSNSATSGVAGRYASALFELADEAKSLDQVAKDLTTFRTLVGESADLARLIASPVIGRDVQGKALLAVLDAAGISGLTRSFIGAVAANGRARDLPAMASAFLAELARRRGETTAEVTSAVPLTPTRARRARHSRRPGRQGRFAPVRFVHPQQARPPAACHEGSCLNGYPRR